MRKGHSGRNMKIFKGINIINEEDGHTFQHGIHFSRNSGRCSVKWFRRTKMTGVCKAEKSLLNILSHESLDKELRVLGYQLLFVPLKEHHYVWTCMHMPWCTGGSQKTTTLWSCFSPSIVMSYEDRTWVRLVPQTLSWRHCAGF